MKEVYNAVIIFVSIILIWIASGYTMEKEIREDMLSNKKVDFYFHKTILIEGSIKELTCE